MKKADPAHDILVVERNRRDDTFGFGVVFSDATLETFAEADAETYAEITRNFAHWDDIDIHYRGEVLTSTGHGFSGLSRQLLLDILQRRCAELGVRLRWETEVGDLGAWADADLVLAADGVNSVVRSRYAEHFRPHIDWRGNKFVWLGTTFPYPAFTFVFKEEDHGLWRVHAYRYNASMSTFILETTEATWRRAGLDQADEDQTIAFAERLFAAELRGHHLLKNRSLWRNFPTVKNACWHHRNIVLIGDAAHTAHFSIGSGTKLAMEDAIALRRALARHDEGEKALVADEEERRPGGESLQRAAQGSPEGVEQTERYHRRLAPSQVAMSLLTPSLPGSRAIGGAGLVMTEMTDVSREGRISPGCTGMYKPEHVAAWKRIVDFIHTHTPAKIGLQLAHAGRKGSTRRLWEGIDEPLESGNWPLIAASPIPYFPHSQVPRAMDRRDMDTVRDDFVRAARMADEAGFDLLELHFAHGYLLASFLSPLTNARDDAYGGSLANRARYPLEVFDAIRATWPAARPVSVRISATDWHEGGMEPDEAVELAKLLRAHGCDIVDVSAGQTVPDQRPVYGRLFQTPFSDRIRHEAGIATMTVGNIASWADVNSIIAAGRADLCVLARAHLYDPYWTRHAAYEQGYDLPWPNQYVPVTGFTPRAAV